jgi:predicted nuclease with TOPRIM domain
MSSFLDGIGALLSKATDYFQGREERRRNEIESIQKEMSKLQEQPATVNSTARYAKLSARLRQLLDNAKNQ